MIRDEEESEPVTAPDASKRSERRIREAVTRRANERAIRYQEQQDSPIWRVVGTFRNGKGPVTVLVSDGWATRRVSGCLQNKGMLECDIGGYRVTQ